MAVKKRKNSYYYNYFSREWLNHYLMIDWSTGKRCWGCQSWSRDTRKRRMAACQVSSHVHHSSWRPKLVGHTEPIISDDINYYNFVGKGCLVDPVSLEIFPSSVVCSSNMLICARFSPSQVQNSSYWNVNILTLLWD